MHNSSFLRRMHKVFVDAARKLRFQGGPLSGVPFSCFPTIALVRFDDTVPSLFRRLWLPLPGVAVSWTTLATTVQFVRRLGRWGRRGFALE